MEKAAASEADEVIFDLEDACAATSKEAARGAVAQALLELAFTGGKVRAYRVNGVDTPWCYRDLVEVLEVAGDHVDAVVVPKVRSAADVHFVDRLVTQIESAKRLPPGRIRLEVLIETAGAVLEAKEIARASPRLDSLIFGVADYAGDLGMRDFRDDQAALFAYPRAHLLAAARAAGLDAIDGVTVQLKNPGRVEADARAAARLGFDGKWAIHPAQLGAIHAAFTPDPAEIERAAHLVEAYARAGREAGLGAALIDGEMVDAATIKVEERKLAIARKAGRLR